MQNHVLDYLDEIIKKVPQKVAFSNGNQSLTFIEIDRISKAIGTWLHKKEIYKEPVVVFMEKQPKEIAAFFGVIRGGCFYVPIDEEMPHGRIELILENVKPKILLCDSECAKIAKTFHGDSEIVCFDEICQTVINEEAIYSIREKAIDTDPIYIVFTSGSTGIPKGVVACHRSVLDYVEHLSEVLGFNENTIFGNQSPLYFDACLKELYPTLKFGATTYLIPRELFMMPVKLVEFLNQYQINTICWVVSALTMISALDTFKTIIPQYLTTIAFGSEVFPVKQFMRWKKTLPEADFFNLYGPTEGTGMCCYYKVDRDFSLEEVIPIGRPFANTEILLLDEKNRQAGKGEAGEICIRGTSLTFGYYHDFEKTSEVFVQNPLNTAYPELIYRTGDLAKYNEAGDLIFISRKDYQIKHMGHRIELGEIEANVNRVDGVKAAGCIYDSKKSKIVLYYTGNIQEHELIAVLKENLPRYMLPNAVRKLEQMLFTANGKIDRQGLKALNE